MLQLRAGPTSRHGEPQLIVNAAGSGVHALLIGGISPQAHAPVLPLLFPNPRVGGLPTFLHADVQLFPLPHCSLLCDLLWSTEIEQLMVSSLGPYRDPANVLACDSCGMSVSICAGSTWERHTKARGYSASNDPAGGTMFSQLTSRLWAVSWAASLPTFEISLHISLLCFNFLLLQK